MSQQTKKNNLVLLFDSDVYNLTIFRFILTAFEKVLNNIKKVKIATKIKHLIYSKYLY